MTSKFIVFEGIDGAGSTTQAKLLFKNLKAKGYKTLEVCNPTDSEIGKLIRRVLRKELKVSPITLQLLFCADRSDFLEHEVKPALGAGKTVISDRYISSTVAYGALDLDMDWLREIQKDFMKADITFLVDTPAKVAMKRMNDRPSAELFEKEKVLEKVRKNYLKLVREEKMVVLDGTQSEEKIAAEALTHALNILRTK